MNNDNTDDTDSVPVTIELRPNERAKLDTFVDELHDEYEQAELADKQQRLDDIDITVDGWQATADSDDWRFLVRSLPRLERTLSVNRVQSLQSRLVRRLRAKLDEFGA